MEMIFRGRHLTISDEFRDYAGQRLGRLTRYLPSADHAIVDVRREAKGSDGRFVVQVTLNANGTFLRAEERAAQLEAAIDSVSDVLSRQVTRFKQRRIARGQRRAEKGPIAEASAEEGEPELPPGVEIISGRVVKRKQFAVKPMTEAEAVEQMELLGHNFFLFRDEDRQGLALLYPPPGRGHGPLPPP